MFFDPIALGAKLVGRTLTDLDLQVAGGVVAFSDDLEGLIAPRKPGLAFTLGAMGSRQHNFYNDVYVYFQSQHFIVEEPTCHQAVVLTSVGVFAT
jgi:hypothetical protein